MTGKKRPLVGAVKVFICCAFLLSLALSSGAAADGQEATVIFSHDMHSHLDPSKTQGGTVGGFARMKTIMDEIRRAHPDPLIVDGGDFSMGTLFQTVTREEAPELRMMGRLGYDAATAGNHEFDYRGAGFAHMLRSAKQSGDPLPALLLANIDYSSGESAGEVRAAMDAYGAKGYEIFEKNGVRIAVFGLFGKNADDYAPLSGLVFSDPVESAKRTLTEIRSAYPDTDLIVCLSHGGTSPIARASEDEILAREAPGIDIIVSGHSHTELPEPITQGNTLIVSAGEYTRNLGQITLRRGADGRFAMTEYRLHRLDDSVEADSETAAQIDSLRASVDRLYLQRFGMRADEVLAYAPFPFTPASSFAAEHREDTLGSLIADSYRYAVEKAEGGAYETVDVAVVPSGVVRGSFAEGPVTAADAFEVSSLGIGEDGVPGYPLVSIYLTGRELRTAAEIDASVSPFMTVAQLYTSGMAFTFNPNRMILNRVTEAHLLTPDGPAPIEDDRLYRVVGGLYSAQMLGAVEKQSFGLLPLTPKDRDGRPITDYAPFIVRDERGEIKEWAALASYLRSFPAGLDGIPVIPARYAAPEGRKIVRNSRNPAELLKNPNRFTLAAAAVVLALAAGAVWIAALFFRRKRKRSILKGGGAQ